MVKYNQDDCGDVFEGKRSLRGPELPDSEIVMVIRGLDMQNMDALG